MVLTNKGNLTFVYKTLNGALVIYKYYKLKLH